MLPAIVISLGLGLADPAAIDQFKTNYGSIQVEIDFVYTQGTADRSFTEALARGERPRFDAEPRREIVGTWGCDGVTERFLVRSGAQAIADVRRARKRPDAIEEYLSPTEALYDGSTLARRTIEKEDIFLAGTNYAHIQILGCPLYGAVSPFYFLA